MRIVLTRRERIDANDGVSIYIVALAQAFIDAGHSVTLVVGSLQDMSEYSRHLCPRLEIPIVALSDRPLGGMGSLRAWVRGARRIGKLAPDLVIHSEAVPIPLPGTTVQVVNDLERRSGVLAPLRRSIRRFSARRSDVIVATTTELRDATARELGLSLDAIELIPKCVDLPAYHGLPQERRERAIFHSGTLPYKQPELSIRAFGALADTTATLYVVGEITKSVQAAVRELPPEIRGKVELLGDVGGNDVRALHGRCRVSSFPTRYEVPVGSGTVIEAIASHTPILGSKRLSQDVLQDEVNGLAVDMTPADISAGMRRLLDDDALWAKLSHGARQMGSCFDAQRVACAYLELAEPGRAQRKRWLFKAA
jgi:glycosyltransferase involved in cell wall biosynthesis